MKVVLISCFGYYKERLIHVEKFFSKYNPEVKVVFSDFDHFTKTTIDDTSKLDFVDYINTTKYKRNISLARIYSHYKFSKRVYKYLEKEKPDFIYSIIPPNSLAQSIGRYKKKYHSKVVLDIYDLWPETMPVLKSKIFAIPYRLWKNLRDKNLNYADGIVTECDLYQEILHTELDNRNVQTIHLTSLYKSNVIKITEDNTLHFCYLGSINNIIDIETIVEILVGVSKERKVFFHLIGDGENRQNFIDQLEKSKISYKYYGKIFENEKKVEILSNCDFGFNVMKGTVCIGLTMKSMDYFSNNLPIINNIKYDTKKLITNYNAGVHINSIGEVVTKLCQIRKEEVLQMKKNVSIMQKKEFVEECFQEKFGKLMQVIDDKER